MAATLILIIYISPLFGFWRLPISSVSDTYYNQRGPWSTYYRLSTCLPCPHDYHNKRMQDFDVAVLFNKYYLPSQHPNHFTFISKLPQMSGELYREVWQIVSPLKVLLVSVVVVIDKGLLWAAWPCATLSPSFGPFYERNHSFGVKMVSQNFPKCFKSCPWAWYPARAKQIYTSGKRSYTSGHICKIFHFALSQLNWVIAVTL